MREYFWIISLENPGLSEYLTEVLYLVKVSLSEEALGVKQLCYKVESRVQNF